MTAIMPGDLGAVAFMIFTLAAVAVIHGIANWRKPRGRSAFVAGSALIGLGGLIVWAAAVASASV